MRILILNTVLFFLTLSLMQAQIKTFDIKQLPSSGNPLGYVDLYQLSPTRILSKSINNDGTALITAIDNEGMIVKQWKSDFQVAQASIYSFDPQSNTIVYLNNEFISRPQGGSKSRIRLILLDSNLVEKSNVILDSTITGIPTEFSYDIKFEGMILLDSSIIWRSNPYSAAIGKEQLFLRISKDGKNTSKLFIQDTSGQTRYAPYIQLPSKEILWYVTTRNSKTNYFKRVLITSDSAFNFSDRPVVDSSNFYYGADKIIPTRDSGFCLAYYYRSGVDDNARVVKYTKDFQMQWMATIVADSYSKGYLELLESKSGGYYVATGGYDTAVTRDPKNVKYWPECYQDVVLSHIDVDGKLLFTAFYGSELCTETPYSMMQDVDGGIIINSIYGEPLRNSPCETLCNEQLSTWLFKVDSLGGPAKKIVGVDEKNETIVGMKLFPNPTSGILTVELGKAGYYTSVEVLDLQGRVLYSSTIEDSKQQLAGIDISGFASGSYYCRLKAPHYLIVRPFVIQK